MITISWIKKPKGLKRNGGLNKHSTVTKNTWSIFSNQLFIDTNWHYLTIIFTESGYRVNTIIWKDEIELLKYVISFPFKYKIYEVSNGRKAVEIYLNTIPPIVKDSYNLLNEVDFCEYYKRVLKGY